MESSENQQHQKHTEQIVGISKGEIINRLRFYHTTTPKKWKSIQNIRAILSEHELLMQGLISTNDLEDFEVTGTGEMDRKIGNDKFVFLSTRDVDHGDIILEFDHRVLDIPGALVNTAGDYLHFVNDSELEEYYKQSQISASQYLDFLVHHLNNLPNPEWFFGLKDGSLDRFLKEALIEKATKNSTSKFKLFLSLYQEIKIPDKIPLNYVIKVTRRSKGSNNTPTHIRS